MVFWALVVLGFPFLHWVASVSQAGINSVVFNIAQLVFFFVWSVWYVHSYESRRRPGPTRN
jgi:uncharacterized membrane protein